MARRSRRRVAISAPTTVPSDVDSELNSRDYIRFEVISEPWSRYKLSDGSFLNVRFVLLKMRRADAQAPPGLHAAQVGSQFLVVVEPHPKFRGAPGPTLPASEIEQYIEAPNLAWHTLLLAPCVYRFEGERSLIAHPKLVRVSRSSKNGPDGDRIYQVVTAAEVAVLGGPSTSARRRGAE